MSKRMNVVDSFRKGNLDRCVQCRVRGSGRFDWNGVRGVKSSSLNGKDEYMKEGVKVLRKGERVEKMAHM